MVELLECPPKVDCMDSPEDVLFNDGNVLGRLIIIRLITS